MKLEWNRVVLVRCAFAVIAISATHFVVTLGLSFYAIESGAMIDDPRHDEGLFMGDAAAVVAKALAQPGLPLIHWLYTAQVPTVPALWCVLFVFIGTSFLWGCRCSFLIECAHVFYRRLRSKPHVGL
jgi:hypothetical protein